MGIATLSEQQSAAACVAPFAIDTTTGASTDARARPLRQRLRDTRGWTLIEMVVVMSLIVVLAGISTALYRNSVTRSKEAVLKEDLFRMRDAIDQYYADKSKYPSDIQALVSDGYMREIPRDPFTKSADTWQTFPAEPDPSNPTIEPGVYNVKSGSDAMSLEGTPYSEW